MPNENNKDIEKITADDLISKLKKQVNMMESKDKESSDSEKLPLQREELVIRRENISKTESVKENIKAEMSAAAGMSATAGMKTYRRPEKTPQAECANDSELDIDALMKKYLPDKIRESAEIPKKKYAVTANKVDTEDVPLTRIGKVQQTEYNTEKDLRGAPEQVEPAAETDINTQKAAIPVKKGDDDFKFDLGENQLDDEPIIDPFADEFEEAPKKKPLFTLPKKDSTIKNQTAQNNAAKEKKKKKEEIEVSGFGRDITAHNTDDNIDESENGLTPPDKHLYDDVILGEEYSEQKKLTDNGNTISVYKSKNNPENAGFDLENDKTREVNKQHVDKSDINLMVALGLEEQLEKTVGIDKVTEFEAELEQKSNKARKYVENEYIDRSQTKDIADAYKYTHASTKLKLLFAVILSLMLLCYENIEMTGRQFGGFNDPAIYPVVYIMIDLQILLLCAAMAYKQIFAGIRALFTGKPMPETITAIIILFGIVHSTISAVYTTPMIEPRIYNFPASICVVMTLVYALYNIKREIFSFNIISARRSKFALTKLPAAQSKLEADSFKDIVDDSPDILKIEKASFIDGYFTRTNENITYTSIIAAIIPIVFAASVVFFIISYINTKSFVTAWTLAYVMMLFGYPVSMFFTYSYPFYKANKEAYENDSTIIGESSLEEYSDATVISFDDKNVFPSYGVKINSMYIFDNNRIDRVLYYATSVFSEVGGPLTDVFDVATIEMERSDNVKILKSETGLLEALVDGKLIMFGCKNVLENNGIDIPEEISEDDKSLDPDVCAMYVARDGVLIAKMFIKYIIDSDFEFILRQLAGSGMCVGVKTFDPNIDETMIGRMVKLDKYPLKVLRNTVSDEYGEANRHIDSGIVTRGTTKSLLQTVSYCEKVLHVRQTNLIIKSLSMIVSMIIVWFIGMYGGMGALRSLYIAVYQLFWLIPVMFATKIFI